MPPSPAQHRPATSSGAVQAAPVRAVRGAPRKKAGRSLATAADRFVKQLSGGGKRLAPATTAALVELATELTHETISLAVLKQRAADEREQRFRFGEATSADLEVMTLLGAPERLKYRFSGRKHDGKRYIEQPFVAAALDQLGLREPDYQLASNPQSSVHREPTASAKLQLQPCFARGSV